MYTAWLMYGDQFKDVYFPDQSNWNKKIVLRQDETGLDHDMYIAVRSLDGSVWVCPNAPLAWKSGGRSECEVKGETVFSLCDTRSGREMRMIVKPFEKQWLRFTKYRLPSRPVAIGRSENADIRDSGALMSGAHGLLGLAQDGSVRYQDRSSNGTYINGRKILNAKVKLNFGDVLAFPTGLKIVYLDKFIAVSQTAGSRECTLEKWLPEDAADKERETAELPSVYREYKRIPRMLVPCQAEDVEIEAPLPKAEPGTQPLLLQVGPSMTMILPMLMGTVVASNGSNMLSSGVVMIGTSSVLAVMWALVNRKYRKKTELLTEERRVGMYRRYIAETELALQAMNEQERERLLDTYPNVAQCAQLPMADTHRLWDRMPLHGDFLDVRVGTGDVDMPCAIGIPKEKLSLIDDALRKEPERLKTAYSVMHDCPVTLALRDEAVIGILGGTRAVLFAQGLLMQIASLHSYHDVRIAVLTDEGSLSQWSWARWLPHVFASEDRQLRMVASDPGDVHDVVAHLEEVLSIRKSNSAETEDDVTEDAGGKKAVPLPHYVVFCTNYHILEDELIMRQLLTNHLGMTLVMLGEDMTSLPKECRLILNVESGRGSIHTSEGMTRAVAFARLKPALSPVFVIAMQLGV